MFACYIYKFYWINKTDLFIVACSYIGNEHGTIKKVFWGMMYLLFTKECILIRKLRSKLTMNGTLSLNMGDNATFNAYNYG